MLQPALPVSATDGRRPFMGPLVHSRLFAKPSSYKVQTGLLQRLRYLWVCGLWKARLLLFCNVCACH